MTSPLLSDCHRLSEDVEGDARQIGIEWKGYRPIVAACADFRRGCDAVAGDRGLQATTIAFVGQKNAGKTHLLSLLVRSEERRAQLRIGAAPGHATERPTWLATKRPTGLRYELEDFIPCAAEDLEPLGIPYALLDVPGHDEGLLERQHAARHALDDARIKVLIIGRAELEVAGWTAYISRTDGASVIPVITKARHLPVSDVHTFKEKLRASLPTSRVLEPIVMPDFTLEGADHRAIINATRRTLSERLVEVATNTSTEISADQELVVRQLRFREEIAALAREHLRATRQGLEPIIRDLNELPQRAAAAMLGEERLLAANICASLRTVLLERTPIFFFPWRLALSIANLIHGATDRLPLVLLGSVPSLLTTSWAAAKNLRDGREFRAEIEVGLRRRVESMLKDQLANRLETLGRNLDADLGRNDQSTARTAEKCSVRLAGLETLQAASTGVFQRVIDRAAPSRLVTRFFGLLGCGIFWAILGQPIYGLYLDFYAAAHQVLTRHANSLAAFPAGTFSMLATSTLLALLPMGLLLLLCVAWITRKKNVDACVTDLQAEHRKEILDLENKKLLRAEISEIRIDACRRLLDADAKHGSAPRLEAGHDG
jgi:hypothetical protein